MKTDIYKTCMMIAICVHDTISTTSRFQSFHTHTLITIKLEKPAINSISKHDVYIYIVLLQSCLVLWWHA